MTAYSHCHGLIYTRINNHIWVIDFGTEWYVDRVCFVTEYCSHAWLASSSPTICFVETTVVTYFVSKILASFYR